MRRLRILALMAAVLIAVPCFSTARAETPEIRIDISGGEVLPGNAAVITVTAPEDGACSIRILDEDGEQIAVVAADRPVSAGYNALYWNGTWNGVAVPEGQWRLVAEMNGRTAETPVTVGRMIPCLIAPAISASKVIPGKRVGAAWCATEAGEVMITLSGGGTERTVVRVPVQAGDGDAVFEASVPAGIYQVTMTLTRADGTVSVRAPKPTDLR